MHRRDALRIFAAGAVLPAFSPELFAFFRQAQPPPGYTLRTLTPHLNDTVVAMIDQIIPATDTPGAKGARVNEFIDVILTEWATPEERKNFLDGLAGHRQTEPIALRQEFCRRHARTATGSTARHRRCGHEQSRGSSSSRQYRCRNPTPSWKAISGKSSSALPFTVTTLLKSALPRN